MNNQLVLLVGMMNAEGQVTSYAALPMFPVSLQCWPQVQLPIPQMNLVPQQHSCKPGSHHDCNCQDCNRTILQQDQLKQIDLEKEFGQQPPKKTKSRTGVASDKQLALVRKLAEENNISEKEICDRYRVTSLSNMTNAQANNFIKDNVP